MNIKVGSYNIRNGLDVKHDFSVIARDITEAGLDICGIQEVDMFTSRNGMQDTMALLAEYTGYAYYRFVKTIDFAGGDYGTAILSKHPIVDFEAVPLYSEGIENRVLGHAVIEIDGEKIDFFNTHLAFESQEIQLIQFSEVAKIFGKCDKAILTGDFNTDRFERFDAFENASKLNNSQNTLLSFEHRAAIDNIVVSESGIIAGGGMLTTQPDHSDHRMLYAEIKF